MIRKLYVQKFQKLIHYGKRNCRRTLYSSKCIREIAHPTDESNNLPWKIIFYGTDKFSLETLKILNENRLGSINRAKVVESLEVICSVVGSPVYQYAVKSGINIHNWPYVLPKDSYDVGIVVSFGHLIDNKSISACKYGMINAHPSLLPRWRGAAPIVHTILNGDKETGITILQISPKKFDKGKILLQERYDVPDNSTTSSLQSLLAPEAGKMVLTCLENLPFLLNQSKPQSQEGVTYAFKVCKSMGQLKLESQTVQDIDWRYRALNDIVKLYSGWQDKHIEFHDIVNLTNMELPQLKNYNFDIKPGFCYFEKKHQILCIKCKDGWIGFETIKLTGKKRMSSEDFHNGYLSKIPKEKWYFKNITTK